MSAYLFSTQPSELASPRAQALVSSMGKTHGAPVIFLFPRPSENSVATSSLLWCDAHQKHIHYDTASLARLTRNLLVITDNQSPPVALDGMACKTAHINAITDAALPGFVHFLLEHYAFDAESNLSEMDLDEYLAQPGLQYHCAEIRSDSADIFQSDIDLALNTVMPPGQRQPLYTHIVLEGAKGQLRLSMGRYIQNKIREYRGNSSAFSNSYHRHPDGLLRCNFLLAY